MVSHGEAKGLSIHAITNADIYILQDQLDEAKQVLTCDAVSSAWRISGRVPTLENANKLLVTEAFVGVMLVV